MTWFTSKKSDGVKLPFPAERLSLLSCILIPAAVHDAIKLRQKTAVSMEQVFQSRFLNAYVCGYCHLLDEYDASLGAAVRFALITTLLTDSDTEAQFRFDAFRLLLERGDSSTVEVRLLAADDGSNYFRALLAHVDADDGATANLRLAIRAYEAFPKFEI